jgi:5S rRNA maturation endonuclease (ribonuclease M5)
MTVPTDTSHHEYLTSQQVKEYLRSVTAGRNAEMLERQARIMGLSLRSLIDMQTTYDSDKAALAAPMFNERGLPSGVRFRRADGRKYSLKGGREGVFMSRHYSPYKLIWLVEGHSDAAACCEIGFKNVVGRPNCSGGLQVIKGLLNNATRTPVIVIADPDDPGRQGATTLIQSIPNPAIVIVGPADLRRFLTNGLDKGKITTKSLQNRCRRAIIEGIENGDENTEWKPLCHNIAGTSYDFVRYIN